MCVATTLDNYLVQGITRTCRYICIWVCVLQHCFRNALNSLIYIYIYIARRYLPCCNPAPWDWMPAVIQMNTAVNPTEIHDRTLACAHSSVSLLYTLAPRKPDQMPLPCHALPLPYQTKCHCHCLKIATPNRKQIWRAREAYIRMIKEKAQPMTAERNRYSLNIH